VAVISLLKALSHLEKVNGHHPHEENECFNSKSFQLKFNQFLDILQVKREYFSLTSILPSINPLFVCVPTGGKKPYKI
jgi:hypothetical protein